MYPALEPEIPVPTGFTASLTYKVHQSSKQFQAGLTGFEVDEPSSRSQDPVEFGNGSNQILTGGINVAGSKRNSNKVETVIGKREAADIGQYEVDIFAFGLGGGDMEHRGREIGGEDLGTVPAQAAQIDGGFAGSGANIEPARSALADCYFGQAFAEDDIHAES